MPISIIGGGGGGGGLSEVDFPDLATDLSAAVGIFDGMYLDSPVVSVASDGATITLSVEKSGGGDLRVVFASEVYVWDCTPICTVSLVAGSDGSPQINYIYYLESTSTLTTSTSGWPVGQYAPVATVLCQSAASLQTDGPYKVHAWTDHARGTVNNGHLAHLNEWIRNQHATHLSGVDQTLTITPNGGAPDNVIFTSAAGSVLQLHDHTFPAFSGTPDIYVVNDSTTPYTKVTDLSALLTDSTGASMSSTRFSLVIWGALSEDGSDCKLFCNLPSGTYGSDSAVISDSNNYADFTIPTEFKGVGFLISELKLRHRTLSSGTWTSIEEKDLRGLYPAISAGGGAATSSEFSDNVFRINNVSDPTKQLDFDVSAITTATTRTITMPDYDVDLGDIDGLHFTDYPSISWVADLALATSETLIGLPAPSTSGLGEKLVSFNGTLAKGLFKNVAGNYIYRTTMGGIVTFGGIIGIRGMFAGVSEEGETNADRSGIIGFTEGPPAIPGGETTLPNQPGIFWYVKHGSSNWWAVCKSDGNTDGTNATQVDTGVSCASLALMDIDMSDPTSIVFKVANNVEATITTNLPTFTNNCGLAMGGTRGSGGSGSRGIAFSRIDIHLQSDA